MPSAEIDARRARRAPAPPGVGGQPRRQSLGRRADAWFERRRALALFVLAAVAGPVDAAPAEQVVAGIDAVVFACTPLDPRSAKSAADLLERARVERKLDLVRIRASAAYRSTYNAELNRLLALPSKERLAACQNAG